MAINYIEDISPDRLNTTRNQRWLKFDTDLAGTPVNAEIVINGVSFPKNPPDPNGDFCFNFEAAAMSLVNINNYCDLLEPDLTTNFIYNEPGYYLNTTVDITITMDDANTDTGSKTLRFKNAVRQKEELKDLDTSPVFEILLPLVNGEYYANYYMGFPFDISMYYMNAGVSVNVQNLTNGDGAILNLTEGVNRLFIENGGAEVFGLLLEDGLNRLEFNVAGVATPFYLNLTKVTSECVSVLKWFNHQGGWSYHGFDTVRESEDSNAADVWNRNHGNLETLNTRRQVTCFVTEKNLQYTDRRTSITETTYLNSLKDSLKVYRWCGDSWMDTLITSGTILINQTGKLVRDVQVNLNELQES